jgi:predicted ATP-grasp superfamily ATP-dependent carboligase
VKVLVTDGANRVALAVVRALGRAGHEVRVTETPRRAVPRPASFDSRHVRRAIVAEDPRAAAEDADVIVPVSSNTVLAMAGLPRTALPDARTLRRANSRDLLLPLARSLGLDVPRTWVPRDAAELKRAADEVGFPAVVKFRTDEGLFLDPADRYAIVRDRDELMLAYGRLGATQERPLIQEFVEGEGRGWSALYDRGRLVAQLSHRRLREYPVTGGPSTACESVRDPAMEAAGRALLEALEWHGVAMVEFKRSGGRVVLMEINPRFWGSLPLGLACGINFPDLLVRVAAGQAPNAAGGYPAGRRVRFFFHDLAAAVRRPGYWKGFLRDLGCRDGILSLEDPRASLRYVANLIHP